jgi:excisionase family DNA binding protein
VSIYHTWNQSLQKGCDQTVTYLNQHESSRQSSIPPRKRLLRLKDAAHYLSLSPWKLRRLIWEGRLPVVQDGEGSPFLFDQRDLDLYVESHKRSAPL